MPVVNQGLEQELGYIENPDEERHIRALWDEADPLMQEISHCLIVGRNEEVDQLTRRALGEGFSANTIMDDGLIAGMAVVGIKFRDNIIFVPEVLVAARAMKAGMAHVEPILSASGIQPIGIVVMGTVKGDLHDIGKNLCIMMLRGAGFVVHDLGVDTQSEAFHRGSGRQRRGHPRHVRPPHNHHAQHGQDHRGLRGGGTAQRGTHHGGRRAPFPGIRRRHGRRRLRQGRHRLRRPS